MWQIKYVKTRLVSRHRGTLPVILTAPHGGDQAPAGVSKRKGKDAAGNPLPTNCNFNLARDRWTRTITKAVAQCILDVLGEAPYVVLADFDRDYIDANRRAVCAYETNAAKPYYDEFHRAIRDFVKEIRLENGGLGLLFDIHGTGGVAADPAGVYLGTADGNLRPNGSTVERLLKVDPQALWRQRSLRGFLEAAGYVVSPRQPGIAENPGLNGGFIVRTYGSANPDGLDAIQIEIDDSVRDDEGKRTAFVQHLAYALRNLASQWAAAHTQAAVRSLHLFGRGIDAPVVHGDDDWEVLRRVASNEWTLRFGGRAYSRGRIEIRHDAGATGEFPAPRRPGVLVLYNENGSDYFLWVDNDGRLRISPSDPGANSQAGTVIGSQT